VLDGLVELDLGRDLDRPLLRETLPDEAVDLGLLLRRQLGHVRQRNVGHAHAASSSSSAAWNDPVMPDDVAAALELVADSLQRLAEHVDALKTTLEGADEAMVYMMTSEIEERLAAMHRTLEEIKRRV